MNKYIHPIHNGFAKPITKQPTKQPTTQFKDVLNKVSQVKVSKHAETRLHERGIHISENNWEKLGKKMSEAKEKGVTDALVVMDEVALVVSTKNNTVITALPHQEAESKIFTNINGTIIM